MDESKLNEARGRILAGDAMPADVEEELLDEGATEAEAKRLVDEAVKARNADYAARGIAAFARGAALAGTGSLLLLAILVTKGKLLAAASRANVVAGPALAVGTLVCVVAGGFLLHRGQVWLAAARTDPRSKPRTP